MPNEWKLVIDPRAQRDLKDFKKDRALREEIVKELANLEANPLEEKPKQGDLKGIRAWRVHWGGATYLIGYMLDLDTKQIVVVQIGAHEGFYERLKRYLNQ